MRGKHGGDDGDENAWKINGCKLCYLYDFPHIMWRDYRGAADNEDKGRGVESCYSTLFPLHSGWWRRKDDPGGDDDEKELTTVDAEFNLFSGMVGEWLALVK